MATPLASVVAVSGSSHSSGTVRHGIRAIRAPEQVRSEAKTCDGSVVRADDGDGASRRLIQSQ